MQNTSCAMYSTPQESYKNQFYNKNNKKTWKKSKEDVQCALLPVLEPSEVLLQNFSSPFLMLQA